MSRICRQNSRKKDTGPLLTSSLCFHQLLADLLACESWGTDDFCSCKTIAAPKPGIPASCECAGGCNLHELQGSRSRSVCAVCLPLFPSLTFQFAFSPWRPAALKWMSAATRDWEGWLAISNWSATLLVWDLLTGLWGNSSYMWTIFYVHQRENKGLSDYKCTVTAKRVKAAKVLSCPLSF